MAKSNRTNLGQAIQRGLEFFYGTARDPESFSEYGDDYVFCLYWISSTSKNPDLRRLARKMGIERARRWRLDNLAVPLDADADIVTDLVRGDYSANRFGVRDSRLRPQLQKAARQFAPHDYFWFDPVVEPPPRDVPEDCDCDAGNDRGSVVCGECKKPLTMMSRYEVWVVALIRSYLGDRYGVTLGAPYRDVLKWLPGNAPISDRAKGK